jgi:hypothetical protein
MQEPSSNAPNPKFIWTSERIEKALILSVILLGLLIYCGSLIKNQLEDIRQKELLHEFVQMSDEFTRPRIYKHKKFASTKVAQFPQDWLYAFEVDSQGKLFIPTPESPCSVKLAFNEEVLVFDSNLMGSYYIEHNKKQEELLFDIVNKISSTEDLKVPVRKCKVVSKDIDATIEGEDLKALVETMELAKLLRKSRYQ